MKRFILPVMMLVAFFLIDNVAQAQRGRVYRGGYYGYRSRPMVSIGIGGAFGGFYGPRVWGRYGYGWGPSVGVSVVLPPPGTKVRGLPAGAQKREINGIVYYSRNDVYYRERQDGGFEVVDAPLGASLYRLPRGAKLRKIEGKYYYEKNGTLYSKETDRNGRDGYVVVGKNGSLDAYDEYDESYPDEYNDMPDDERYEEETRQAPEVRNGNRAEESQNGTYSVRPQAGDQFEQLPRNSRQVTKEGKVYFMSPSGVYYKEVKDGDGVIYEVVDVK